MIMRREDLRVAVVGAGIAGLNCAGRLMGLGFPVEVFDKGRRPGGRSSQRQEGAWRFEPGAPGTHDIVRRLAAGLMIHTRVRVTAIESLGDRRWRLVHDQSLRTAPFDIVVLAVPAPQAVDLLSLAPGLARVTGTVAMEPCLTSLVGFARELEGSPAELALGAGDLQRAVRQESVAQRLGRDAWVLYGEPQFSRDNLDCDLDLVARHLVAEFARAIDAELPTIEYLRGYRWRYAHARRPLGMDCLYDPMLGLGVCGDWCRGTRVDDALVSGRALAARIVAGRHQAVSVPPAAGSQRWS